MRVLFNEEKISIIVELDQSVPIPEAIQIYAQQQGLQEKHEFHFTPITFTQGKEILRQFQALGLSREQQRGVMTHIKEIAEKTTWDVTTTETFYHVRKKYTFPNKTVVKESIVQTMESTSLREFIAYINKLLSMDLKSFGHITLFVKSDDPEEKTPGIGISSEEELKALIIKVL